MRWWQATSCLCRSLHPINIPQKTGQLWMEYYKNAMSSWCTLQHQKIACTQLAASLNQCTFFFGCVFVLCGNSFCAFNRLQTQWGENLEGIEQDKQPKTPLQCERAKRKGDADYITQSNRNRKHRAKMAKLRQKKAEKEQIWQWWSNVPRKKSTASFLFSAWKDFYSQTFFYVSPFSQ